MCASFSASLHLPPPQEATELAAGVCFWPVLNVCFYLIESNPPPPPPPVATAAVVAPCVYVRTAPPASLLYN